jgi:non-heme chloroperoxidase
MNTKINVVAAILKKDVLTFYPLLLLTALVHVLDVVQRMLHWWPVLDFFLPTLLVLVNCAAIFAVIQADPAVSLTDDWLCRPVPRSALLIAKGALLLLTLYLPRVLATLATDLGRSYPFAEAVLEALLFQDWLSMLYLPIVVMAAVCTANLIQGLGVMVGLFVLIFVVPTPFVAPWGPEDMAVGEAILANGLEWMGMMPAKIIFIVMMLLCLWAAYQRRNLRVARAALGGGVALGALAFIMPMVLMPWEQTFALQGAARGESLTEQVSLHRELACFPAQRVADIANDSDFNNAKLRLGLRPWSDAQLQAAGQQSIAFVTRVSPRGLPRDWRVQVAYAKARYVSNAATLATLRPSAFTTGNGIGLDGETITHTWLLPEAALQKLSRVTEPALEIEYSAAVLKPVSAMLQIDAGRKYLSGIGHCGATRDELNNRIRIDCLSAGGRAALIAAELDGVPASRVDGMLPDYAPTWLRSLTTTRVTLDVKSPLLVESNVVKVSAYLPEAFTTLTVSSRGMLGNTLAACPLPATRTDVPSHISSWNDRSAHTSRFVTVDDGVALEVLDWGGKGAPIILLPGLGATAHSFDELALLLAKSNRVLGITRRGMGSSGRPDHGYSQQRLVQDILRVLDALNIDRAVFVGHSIAGDELTTLGVNYPERITGLIYLDAAYDRGAEPSERYRELGVSLPDRPPPLPDDLLSYATLREYLTRTGSDLLPEGELIAMYNMGNRYLAGQITLDPRIPQAIRAGIHSPDYAKLHVPALALYATSRGPNALMRPWYDASDAALRTRLQELQSINDSAQRRSIEKFANGVRGARVIEIPGATHWIFISNPDEVLDAIRGFVDSLPLRAPGPGA